MISPPSQPKMDLVAVAYNAVPETEKFLQSFINVDVEFTLIVIDNDSTDPRMSGVLEEGIDYIRSMANCLSAATVMNSANVGYAKACNAGASLGNAPVIGLLNCDVLWLPGASRGLYESFMYNPRVGVVGPRTTTSDGLITHAGIIKQPNGEDTHRGWMSNSDSMGRDVRLVPTVAGATYFVRRRMWEDLTECPEYQKVAPDAQGAFLPTRHYFEETFCSVHARAHGWDVVYNGNVEMIHEWHKSSPIGGVGEQAWKESKEYFHEACEAHQIDPRAPMEQGPYPLRTE